MQIQRKIKLFYEKVSPHYPHIKESNFELNHLEDFHFKKIIPKKLAGKKILDIGCGIGYNLRYYSRKKAITYGIDISLNNIKQSQKNSPKSTVSQGDILKSDFFDEIFDIITINLMLDHISFPQKKKLFKKIFEHLSPSGLFIFSHKNPVIEGLDYIVKNENDNDNFLETWKLNHGSNGYFSNNKLKQKDFYGATMYKYHTTYQEMISLILKSGFQILHYSDCPPPKRIREKYGDLYEYYFQIPQFIIWKVGK